MPCAACDKIERMRRGEEPAFVAELDESFISLADDARYEGWCTLFLKTHDEHLHRLPLARQCRLFHDVARVAAAIAGSLTPVRLNYECLGNVLHHVHWHLIPRYATDPEPAATIWTRPAADKALAVGPERRDQLVQQLREALAVQSSDSALG